MQEGSAVLKAKPAGFQAAFQPAHPRCISSALVTPGKNHLAVQTRLSWAFLCWGVPKPSESTISGDAPWILLYDGHVLCANVLLECGSLETAKGKINHCGLKVDTNFVLSLWLGEEQGVQTGGLKGR